MKKSNMQNNWKNSIKNSFKNRRIEPQRDLWSELEKQLDQHEVKPPKNKKWFYLAVASVALLIGIGAFVFQHISPINGTENEVMATSNKQEIHLQMNNSIQKTDTEIIAPVATKSGTKEERPSLFQPKTEAQIAKQSADFKIDTNQYIEHIFDGISSEEMIAQAQQELELEHRIDSLFNTMAFSDISVDELLLIASAEIKIDQYIESQSDTKKMLSDVEKLNLKERIHLFFDKVSNEYDKLKIAFVK